MAPMTIAFQAACGIGRFSQQRFPSSRSVCRKGRPNNAVVACLEIPGIDMASRNSAIAAAKAARLSEGIEGAKDEGEDGKEESLGPFREDIPLINTVMFTGRLGADPILRQVGANGTYLCTFSLAVNTARGGGYTSWFKINVWGTLGERAAGMMRKGLRVGIVGSMGMDDYVDKQGRNRTSMYINAKSFEVLQSRSEFTDDGPGSSAGSRGYSNSNYQQRRAPRSRNVSSSPPSGGGGGSDEPF